MFLLVNLSQRQARRESLLAKRPCSAGPHLQAAERGKQPMRRDPLQRQVRLALPSDGVRRREPVSVSYNSSI